MWPSRLPARALLSFQPRTSGPLTASAFLRRHVAVRPFGAVQGHKSARSHTRGHEAQDSELSSEKAGSYILQSNYRGSHVVDDIGKQFLNNETKASHSKWI